MEQADSCRHACTAAAGGASGHTMARRYAIVLSQDMQMLAHLDASYVGAVVEVCTLCQQRQWVPAVAALSSLLQSSSSACI